MVFNSELKAHYNFYLINTCISFVYIWIMYLKQNIPIYDIIGLL